MAAALRSGGLPEKGGPPGPACLLGVLFVWVISALLKLGLPYLTIMAPKIFPEDLFERSIILNLTYYLNVLRGALDFSYIKKLLGN